MAEPITISYDAPGGEPIRITATPSEMHRESCVFVVNRTLYASGSAHFRSAGDGHASPLIDALFGLGPVNDITVSRDTLRINLAGAEWEDYIPRVGAIVRDVLLSGEAAISSAVGDTQLAPEEIQRRVQNVLDTVINPAVASHGGVVSLIDVTDNTVFLEFGGGCQGCGMINVTLKYGVERTIREEVPEVGEILDTTDHASGRNPYYAPSSK